MSPFKNDLVTLRTSAEAFNLYILKPGRVRALRLAQSCAIIQIGGAEFLYRCPEQECICQCTLMTIPTSSSVSIMPKMYVTINLMIFLGAIAIIDIGQCSDIFQPGMGLPPNLLSLPIDYHGRASSIVISGTPVTRP